VPVLDRDDAAGGETLAVADAVDLVDDRHLRIAAEQKIGVQRMGMAAVHRSAGGDKGLPDHLTAEHTLPPRLRAAAAKQVDLDRF
jgi:hypothetical protein